MRCVSCQETHPESVRGHIVDGHTASEEGLSRTWLTRSSTSVAAWSNSFLVICGRRDHQFHDPAGSFPGDPVDTAARPDGGARRLPGARREGAQGKSGTRSSASTSRSSPSTSTTGRTSPGRPRRVAHELPAAGHREDRGGDPLDGRPARSSRTIIAFLIGTFAGALVAWPKSPRAVRILAPPFLLLSSIPYYLLAILLIFLFAVVLKAVPAGGRVQPDDDRRPQRELGRRHRAARVPAVVCRSSSGRSASGHSGCAA